MEAKKVGDRNRREPEGSLFNSYYRYRKRCYFFPLDCSILPLIRTLKCWVLSKEVSSTIFWIFGITRLGIDPDYWRTLYPMGRWSNAPTSTILSTIEWTALITWCTRSKRAHTTKIMQNFWHFLVHLNS